MFVICNNNIVRIYACFRKLSNINSYYGINFRHILILDSVTWDLDIRITELDNIHRYVLSVLYCLMHINAILHKHPENNKVLP